MRQSNQIVYAGLNRKKLEEFQSLLKGYSDIEIISAESVIRNPEGLKYVERFNTYLENAIAKARMANAGCHYPCMADDTGLEVISLDGKPGVRSHRYAPPRSGLSQDLANQELLFKELENRDREARFVCTLVLIMEGISVHSTGMMEGRISERPRGEFGFGYDKVFIPKGSQKTFAEMTMAEKNLISHRSKSFYSLMEKIKSLGIVLAKP